MYDVNSATFVPQNSIGLTDRCRPTYRQCNPALLHPQIGYILATAHPLDFGVVTMPRPISYIPDEGGSKVHLPTNALHSKNRCTSDGDV
jgi:hypothetical protein